jgi:hypothetical protein
MVCKISCGISIMFIIAMIYMNAMSYKNKTVQNYRNQLPDELKVKYDNIVKERIKIYYQGYILGFIISLLIILYNYYSNKNEKLSLTNMLCIVLATSFITNYFYYILHPKDDWMLDTDVNKDPEQVKAWLEMYKQMQNYYHTGLLLGIIAILALTIAFRCN